MCVLACPSFVCVGVCVCLGMWRTWHFAAKGQLSTDVPAVEDEIITGDAYSLHPATRLSRPRSVSLCSYPSLTLVTI